MKPELKINAQNIGLEEFFNIIFLEAFLNNLRFEMNICGKKWYRNENKCRPERQNTR